MLASRPANSARIRASGPPIGVKTSSSPQIRESPISTLVPAVFRVFKKDEAVTMTDDH